MKSSHIEIITTLIGTTFCTLFLYVMCLKYATIYFEFSSTDLFIESEIGKMCVQRKE